MKVQLRDKEAMDSLTVANLRAYLQAHGWSNERSWGTWATILCKEERGKMWEVAVPNEAGGLLYTENVAEIIATLAEAEGRSQLDVFYDLANPMVGTLPRDVRKRDEKMPNVWCVRAEYGKYTSNFVSGGYIGLGWMPGTDLTLIKDRSELYPLYQQTYPQDTSNIVIGQQVGQISRFLLEISVGDYVITPTEDVSTLRYGKVTSAPYYLQSIPDDCPYHHRRATEWAEHTLNRSELSMPFRYTLQSAMTVFAVSHREEFLTANHWC